MGWVELDYAEEPGISQVLPVAWSGVDFDTWASHFPLWTNMVTSIASTGSWAGWSRTHCCLLGILEHHSSLQGTEALVAQGKNGCKFLPEFNGKERKDHVLVRVSITVIKQKKQLVGTEFISSYSLRFITGGGWGRNSRQNLESGTEVEAVKKHCILVCYLWFSQTFALHHPGPPAQG